MKIGCFLVGVFFSLVVCADITIVQEETDLQKNSLLSSYTYIGSSAVRGDSGCTAPSSCGRSMIMLLNEEKIIFLDHAKKTVREIAVKDIETMRAQQTPEMKAAMAKMEAMKKDPRFQAQMAKLPPSMKAMMGGDPTAMMQGALSNLVVKKTGRASVKNISCDLFEIYITSGSEKKVSEICVTDAEKVGFKATDIPNYSKYWELSQRISGLSPKSLAAYVEAFKKAGMPQGFTLRSLTFLPSDSHKPIRKHEFKELLKTKIDSRIFDVPQNYKKEATVVSPQKP